MMYHSYPNCRLRRKSATIPHRQSNGPRPPQLQECRALAMSVPTRTIAAKMARNQLFTTRPHRLFPERPQCGIFNH